MNPGEIERGPVPPEAPRGSAFFAIFFFLARNGASSPAAQWFADKAVFVIAPLVGIGVFYFSLRRARRKVDLLRKALQTSDLNAIDEALKQIYSIQGRFMPDWEFAFAADRATMRALYGDGAGARALIEAPDWRGRPGPIRGHRAMAEALILALIDRDYTRASAAADEHARLCGCDPRKRPSVAVIVASALEGDPIQLPPKISALGPINEALLMFAAAVAAGRQGKVEEQERALERVRALAPHCTVLHSVPPQSARG